MPLICFFYGISIYMYYNDHDPPHFHAFYGEHEAKVSVESATILAGQLPQRALKLVRHWADAHQRELNDDWDRARKHAPLRQIEPLE